MPGSVGDAGSGYDLGRRAISRGLLELQGWAPPTPLGTAVRNHAQLGVAVDAAGVTKFFYQHADPNRQIAGLAPAVLRLAEEGDSVAREIVAGSVKEHLGLALQVVGKLFPGVDPATLPAGLSGPILTHPVVATILAAECGLRLVPVEGTPVASGEVDFGTTLAGLSQRFPVAGAPAALVAGQQYYLYVSKDVGVPITRCLFTYG